MPNRCGSMLIAMTLPLAAVAFAQDAVEDSLDRDYSSELPRIAPKEPLEALDTFVVHDGFRIEQVAAEPLVQDPVAMAFDERGRLFVVEMRGYSERRDERTGRIRLLEDTDGDGRFDTSSVYAGGLAWPTAVACYDGGVFVGAAPDIFYYKDADGDGKAELKRHIYTGFGRDNVQGLLNTFKWGLDNRIHGAASGSGGNIQPAGTVSRPIPISGRDFSFDPRSLDFKAASGGGQHGLTFDLAGRKFVCHNSDHILMIMYENSYAARNPFLAPPRARLSIALEGPQAGVFRISPVEPWRIVRTRLRVKGFVRGPIEGGGTASGYFTSATGITVYKGDAYPPEYRGQVFIGDVGSNLIHRKRLFSDGIVRRAERIDEGAEFVASTDIWFRPVQFCNGPDGALYVADMYREVIEHPNSLPPLIKKHLDLNSGFDRGRIYRIVPTDFVQPAVPGLGRESTAALAGLLGHPNAWHHETAARLLYERQDASSAAALERAARESKPVHGRLRALYALDGLGQLREGSVLDALGDGSPELRIHGLRLSERFLQHPGALQEKVLSMTDDRELVVRYQLAFTLGAIARSESRSAALARLARNDAADSWMRLAIQSSLAAGAADVLSRLAGDSGFPGAPGALEFIEELASLAGAAGQAGGIRLALDAAESISGSERTFAETLVRGLLKGLRKAPRDSRAHVVVSESPIARGIVRGMVEKALRGAADASLAQGRRVELVQTLGLAPFDAAQPVLVALFKQPHPRAVQLAALRTLGLFDHASVAPAILNAWPNFTPGLRAEAIEILFSNENGLNTLLDAIENVDFAKSNVDSIRGQYLQTHPLEPIRERAQRLFKRRSPENLEAVIAEYRTALDAAGSPSAGRALFEEHCAQCHRFQGLGYDVGPDLASMANRGAETILVNVIDPNREINPRYVNYVLSTRSGQVATGILDSETVTSVTLRRAGGLEDTVLRVNIEELRSSDLSIMPEGLQEGLGLQGMADLIAFLLSEAE